MLTRLLSLVKGDPSFRRNFIVYIVSNFLLGNKNQYANLWILKSLIDTNEVQKLDWCKFVYENLMKSCLSWKKEGGGVFVGSGLFVVVSRILLFYVEHSILTTCAFVVYETCAFCFLMCMYMYFGCFVSKDLSFRLKNFSNYGWMDFREGERRANEEVEFGFGKGFVDVPYLLDNH